MANVSIGLNHMRKKYTQLGARILHSAEKHSLNQKVNKNEAFI